MDPNADKEVDLNFAAVNCFAAQFRLCEPFSGTCIWC